MKCTNIGVGLTLAATLAWAAPAKAQAIDINCSGTVQQTWSPGLKLLPQLVDYSNTTEYTTCTSTDPDITEGAIFVTAEYTDSCLANVGTTGEFTVEWSDGTSSTMALEAVGINVVGTVQIFTAIGTVSAGRFLGDQAVMVNTYVVTQLAACLTPQGLTELSGSTSLVLIDI